MRQNKTWTKWSPKMFEILRRDYGKTTASELASRLGVTVSALRRRAIRLDLVKHHNKWTTEMTEIIRQDYGRVPTSELTARFGVTACSLKVKAERLGIKIYYKPTSKEVEKINQLRNKYTDKEVAEMLGLNDRQVRNHGTQNKPNEFIRKIHKEMAIKRDAINSMNLSDRQMAMYLAGGRNEQRSEKSKIYLNYPHLIELKRNQLLLNRQIKKLSNG